MLFKGWNITVKFIDDNELNTTNIHDNHKLTKTEIRKKIGKKKIVSVVYKREYYYCEAVGKVLDYDKRECKRTY